MHLQAYNIDGSPMRGAGRIPVSQWSFDLQLNESGSITFDIPKSLRARLYGARQKLRPWRSMVALRDGDRVIAAGPVTRRSWSDGKLSVTVGDGLDFFKKRLVLNSRLINEWRDGEVVIDEDNPPAEWMLNFSGLSLAGIANGLLRETLRWGSLPIDAPSEPLQYGIHERSYRCFDFAQVYDRLQDLQGVINGPKIRCSPYLTAAGHLRFKFEAGFVGDVFDLSTTLEGHGIILDNVDEDGDSIANQVFAMGGRDDDIVLVARGRADVPGLLLMQQSVMNHSSVSRITTLKDHVSSALIDGCTIPESTKLTARRSHGIRPGDRINLTTSNAYHGDGVKIGINVVQVSGDNGEWVSVTGFPDSEIGNA